MLTRLNFFNNYFKDAFFEGLVVQTTTSLGYQFNKINVVSQANYFMDLQKINNGGRGAARHARFMNIPAEEFSIPNLEQQFHLSIVPVLQSYKLEYKAHFVEFEALLDLMTKRFRYLHDDVDHEKHF
ncbi:hypothetical protein [Chryseolinea sp. H1M3-3]|uniref:hypothetical protein n=1 Tax=Chryseolinea sp. H1M3-3 TaxID=3034144 RepID=UPI0023EAD402|nr:hypothetical protein [Chryseolinea sp. H1M3-3]